MTGPPGGARRAVAARAGRGAGDGARRAGGVVRGRRGQGRRGAGAEPGAARRGRRRTRGCGPRPTLPAAELYTGVLYDALGLATLGPRPRRRAGRVAAGLLRAVGSGAARRPRSRRTAARWACGCRGWAALAAYWRPFMDAGAAARPPAAVWCSTCAPRRTRRLEAARARWPGVRRRYGCSRCGGRRGRAADGGEPLQQGDQGPAGPRIAGVGCAPADPAALAAVLRDLGFAVEEAPSRARPGWTCWCGSSTRDLPAGSESPPRPWLTEIPPGTPEARARARVGARPRAPQRPGPDPAAPCRPGAGPAGRGARLR